MEGGLTEAILSGTGRGLLWIDRLMTMSDAPAADRKATRDEVVAHASSLRESVARLGLGSLRIRDDGTLAIHSDDPGYKTANRLSVIAGHVVGAYVHVITDDVPGAAVSSGNCDRRGGPDQPHRDPGTDPRSHSCGEGFLGRRSRPALGDRASVDHRRRVPTGWSVDRGVKHGRSWNRLADALPGDLSTDWIWTADLEPILDELYRHR